MRRVNISLFLHILVSRMISVKVLLTMTCLLLIIVGSLPVVSKMEGAGREGSG